MTVGELINLLQDFDPETPVRLASQPNYPMEYNIRRVAETEDADDEGLGIAWIVEGRQLGYMSREAAENCWQ
ncbi:hypothetical protein [Nocardia altamirensis]|uniref:hypothetical protein n=1 Tax=Nocardia altamirensis TaxID=472158 RepID=UPI0008404A8A|nr:hypothetical protein [Nocardia altamirensis]